MSQTPATTEFDYGKLDEDTASKLEFLANDGKRAIGDAMTRLGKVLSDARKVLADHNEGTFIKWATSEFPLGKSTVYRYMNAWDRWLSHGGTTPTNFSPTAIYLLTADSTPSEIRAKALSLAKRKNNVTKADIQRLIESNGASKPTAGKTKKSGNGKPSKTEKPPASTGGGGQKASLADGTPGADGACSPSSPERGGSTPPAFESTEATANGKEPWRVERSRAKKTTEALMRSLGDLNDLRKITFLAQSLEDCRAIIAELDAMK